MHGLWLHRIKPFLFCFLIFTSGASLADEPIYSLAESPPADESKPISVSINTSVANSLKIGQEVTVPLSDGRVLQGKVTNTLSDGDVSSAAKSDSRVATKTWIVALPEQTGALEVTIKNDTVSQLLLFDAKKVTYQLANIDSRGQGTFILQDANDHHCVNFPDTFSTTTAIPLDAEDSGSSNAAFTPDISTLKKLQSKPNAPNVIFIDYWGGTVSETIWNDRFNGGFDFDYTPYGGNSTFSEAEINRMWLAWREAAEDYAQFNVNVTTDIDIFNATTNPNKVRNIVTSTRFLNAGGVAFLHTFGRDSDYAQISWTWNPAKGSMGQTISHESGHQMGLRHDGDASNPDYYSGHGNWGPIMGAPFGQKYVQFSKGDYPGANNQEDDLAIVNNKLGATADEAGETTGSAQAITLPANDLRGVISPVGLAADTDVYQFTLTSPQQVDLSVAPLIPSIDDTENLGTNLSMKASLLDAAGTPVEQASPTGLPTADGLTYSESLDAGTYYIQVEALSDNPNWSAGFGEYGNGGFYNIAISGESSCGGSFELASNQWKQISLPCNPGSSNTVDDIFPNMPGTYGTDWAVWRYDTDNNNNSYVDLTLSGPLEQGVGYWIIQNSANPVTLAMPSGSTPTAAASFDIPLATISNDNQWNMIGYPYDTAGTLGNTTVAADSGVCAPSCDLDTAESGAIVHNQLWSYNGIDDYALINTSENLEPWMGYWSPTLANAATVAPVKLVVPKP